MARAARQEATTASAFWWLPPVARIDRMQDALDAGVEPDPAEALALHNEHARAWNWSSSRRGGRRVHGRRESTPRRQ